MTGRHEPPHAAAKGESAERSIIGDGNVVVDLKIEVNVNKSEGGPHPPAAHGEHPAGDERVRRMEEEIRRLRGELEQARSRKPEAAERGGDRDRREKDRDD